MWSATSGYGPCERQIILTDSTPSAKASLAHFVLDTRASSFTVQAFATGFLSAVGHNPTIGISKFSGAVDFDPEAVAGSGFLLTIQAASLCVRDDISDKDRREIERVMREEVLEVTRYPEIRYEASSISFTKLDSALYSATLNGHLSLHGVRRDQPMTSRVALLAEMLRASGSFTLKQSDFHIKPVSIAAGALKVKDELKFSFEMIARRQD
jgi:polyisoprenoid-binding protein YceI